jgi:MICOS complex subunit MIC26
MSLHLLISMQSRKPIYDDNEKSPSSIPTRTPVSSDLRSTVPKARLPTPTDRLAIQIGKSRMFIYAHIAAVEDKVNSMMDSFFHLENSFTGTIASLAPSSESGEKLMPGCLYVLVAAMSGSIISRNRNIFLRGAVPVALGIGAGWIVLPVTMRNISDLLWTYEEKFPVLAEGHLRTRKSIEKAWDMAKLHKDHAVRVVDEKISEGREAIEGWVKKGK